MIEIGSEFWLEEIKNNGINGQFYDLIQFGSSYKMLFSGRTAIDFVLQDISRPIKKVYMPSYACQSMLQPFKSREINIEFYDVVVNEDSGLDYRIDFAKEFDVFFAISYFGYEESFMDSVMEEFHNKDIIIIEDITHRMLNDNNHSKKADYYIASLRKWFPILSGGIAIKKNGTFKDIPLISPSKQLMKSKKKAMQLKSEYIKDSNQIDLSARKSVFLKYYSVFNKMISINYKNITIDDYSKMLLSDININKVKKIRKNNAKAIHDYLNSNSKNIRPLFKEVGKSDYPLFVPTIVKKHIRDLLRQHLIKNRIYCPIHWPIFDEDLMSNGREKIYQQELSLICDHRYGLNEIKRIIKSIGEFEN